MTDRRISDKVYAVNLTGYLLLIKNSANPALLCMDNDQLFLPVFKTREGIEKLTKNIPLDYDKISQIRDHSEFLNSVPPDISVIIDPYVHENGKVRYVRVFENFEEMPAFLPEA